MTSWRGERGAWGESQGCAFLERQGFEVVERNFHTTGGEIDIVAMKGDDVYFVEVKTRRAGPLAYDTAVTTEKVRRLRKAVAAYCFRRKITEKGLILATLMVVVDVSRQRVAFRLAIVP